MFMLLESNITAKEGTNQQPKIEWLFLIFLKEKSQPRGSYKSPPVSLMKPAIANAPKEILHA